MVTDLKEVKTEPTNASQHAGLRSVSHQRPEACEQCTNKQKKLVKLTSVLMGHGYALKMLVLYI